MNCIKKTQCHLNESKNRNKPNKNWRVSLTNKRNISKCTILFLLQFNGSSESKKEIPAKGNEVIRWNKLCDSIVLTYETFHAFSISFSTFFTYGLTADWTVALQSQHKMYVLFHFLWVDFVQSCFTSQCSHCRFVVSIFHICFCCCCFFYECKAHKIFV